MERLLPGLSGALNYHPIFVHFPIAFWLAALLFEALSLLSSSAELHRTAARLLYLGTLSAILAAWSGLLAEESVPETGPAQAVMQFHMKMMLTTTSAAVGLSMLAFFRRNTFTPALRKLFLVGLIALAVLLVLGTDRGAQLVYQHATSVRLPAPLR